MSRVIIHIGTHKTGTTTIQKTIFRGKDIALQNGIWYPDYKDTILNSSIKSHYAHIGIANALNMDHPLLNKNDAMQFFASIREKSKNFKATLISAEPLYRHISSKSKPQHIRKHQDYWDSRKSFISDFRELTGSAEVVVVFRRPDEFAESMYQEQIKSTRYSGSFKEFIRDFWFHFEYEKQVECWKMFFDTVTVIPFEKISGNNITKSFLKEVGIEIPNLPEQKYQNLRIPYAGLKVKKELNRTEIDDATLKDISFIISSLYENKPSNKQSLFESAESRASFIEQSTRSEFYQRFNWTLPESQVHNVDPLSGFIKDEILSQEFHDLLSKIWYKLPSCSKEHMANYFLNKPSVISCLTGSTKLNILMFTNRVKRLLISHIL